MKYFQTGGTFGNNNNNNNNNNVYLPNSSGRTNYRAKMTKKKK
jgi:hypothetical protein